MQDCRVTRGHRKGAAGRYAERSVAASNLQGKSGMLEESMSMRSLPAQDLMRAERAGSSSKNMVQKRGAA